MIIYNKQSMVNDDRSEITTQWGSMTDRRSRINNNDNIEVIDQW